MNARRVIILLLLICSYAFAQRGSRSSGSHSSHSSKSSSSKSSSSSKTVHVREYTRKDGTIVRAHDRRAPGTASMTTPYRPGHAAAGYPLHSSVQRDSRGRIKRSSSARSAFMREHPCPATGKTSGRCPGYVIDHVTALECGGADAPGNMQWQTTAAAKAKDRAERYCR